MLNTPTEEPNWSDEAAKEFGIEFSKDIDFLFIQNIKKGLDPATSLQGAIREVYKVYGFEYE